VSASQATGDRPQATGARLEGEAHASEVAPKRREDFNITLNGYRGLCAMAVFMFHVGSAGVKPWPEGTPVKDFIHFFWTSFAYGVDMFFMISGFVILGSLLRHPSVGGFLKDRFIRIFSAWVPALIAVTIVCVALRMKMFENVTPLEGVGIFAANLVLLPPLAPIPMVHYGSWSLTYEWVFYFTAAAGAIIWRGYSRDAGRSLAMALWGIAAATFICLYPRSMYFLTGVLVFHYRDLLARHRRLLGFPVVSLLVFLLAWRSTEVSRAELSTTWLNFLVDGRWVFAVVAFVASLHLFASVCLNASRQTDFLNGRVSQFLGNISYSFYLWHALVMSVVKRVVNAWVSPHVGTTAGLIIFAVVGLAIALPVSWLSWQLFEVRVAKWLRRNLGTRRAIGGAVHAP
jgi:peptidoglycan/LPS O-acetylase OafA/YrhL